MAQNRRTSDGVYDALKQISVEEKIDFGLDKYTPETFRKKYFTGPGNIENLYNILEGISKDEKIDFGQGTRDEWLESFGYRRSAEDGRYETLEGKRAGGAADVEEMNRRKQARKQTQPTSAVPQVNPTDTQPQQPAPSQPTTPKSADNNKISRAQGIRQTGDPGATQLGVPFKPDTRMTAAERDKVYRENDFAVRQVRAMQNEEKHRQQPLVDTGSEEANKHIIKTEGEWEDDLQKGASRISRSVVTPAIGKAIAEFDKKAHEVFEEGRRGSNDGTIPTGVAGGAGVFGNVRESNLTKDPDKILKYLQQQMEGVYNDPSFAEEIGKEADKAGIDRTEYMEKVIKPQIESDLGRQFENAMVDRYLPKSGLEYVVGGLSNSIVGMIADTFLNTKSQQYYKNQAEAMTEEGKNPYYNPGTGASLARVGVTFAADAPFFGVSGRVGGMAAKNLAERQIKTMMAKGLSENAARSIVGTALENSVGVRMKNYIMQHVVSSGITMGGFNAMSEAARQTRDKEGYDLGKIAESTAEGLATGAAFGLTGGAVQALSQPLTGIAKVGSKVAGFGAEAETMYATEELSKMAHGEEGFENPFEGSVEALMKLGVMKASSPGGLVKSAEGIIHPIKSNQRQRTGMQFSKEEENYVRNTAEGKSLFDALSNMHPEIAISEVNGKKQLTPEGEQMRRQLADNYNDFMANKEIPATVKQKVAGVLGGVYRPGLETGADIIHNNDGSVILKTRDKDGNCIRDIKFDSFSDAEQWRDTFEDEFKLNDAVNMWNGTTDERRVAAIMEVAEMYGMSPDDAAKTVRSALDAKDTSLDREQYNFVYDAIARNAYPADEYNPQRRYQEGKQLTPEERHFAQADAQVAEERLAQYGDDFAKEVIDAAEYPDEKMAELATRSDITKEQVEAARDYYNSAAKVRGMMDEAIKGIDEQVEAANAEIRRNTHPDSGALITGTHDGNNFYVTAGHFQITPDGRIEPTDNSGAVIVRDINTGEIEVMSPKDITITAINDPVRMMEANDSMEGLRGELIKQADDSIEFAPGTPETPQEMGEVFTGADGKMYMVTGEPDETGNVTWMKLEIGEDGNPVGSPQPLDIEEYRKAKSDEIDAANRPTEEQTLGQEGQINDTNNGQNYAQNQPENMHNEAQPSETQQETKGQINGQNGGQNEGQPQNASRIPVDDKGRQQFEQAKPEDTLAELTEKHGAEKTERMVSQIIENAARKLDELSKKDVSDITDMADLEAHEAEIAALQGKLDYWNGISEAIKSEKAKKTWENLVNPKEIRNFAKDPGGQQKWVDEHIDEIVDSYTRTHGNLLDPDELRNALTPIGYNGKNVPDFKRQTDRLVQAVYEKMLLKAVENGNASITLLTGAGGAGKSTATRQMDLSGRGVVYDAAFNRFNKLDKAIEAAKAAGMKDIQVIAVYNDADTSFSNTLKRGKENGRFLSLDYFVNDAFMNNQDKIGQLRQAHPDVEIVAFDNSGNRASERPEGGRVSVDEAEKWDYTLNDAKLNELLDIFENGINEGRFAEDEIASVGQGLRGVTRRIPDLRVQTEQRVSGLVRRISGQDVPDLRPGVSGEPVQRGRGGLVPPADGGVQGSPEERKAEGVTGSSGQTPATEARTDEETGNGRPDRPAAGSDGGDGPEPPAAGAAGGSGAAVPAIDSGRTGGIDESIPSDTEGAVRGGGHTSDSAGSDGGDGPEPPAAGAAGGSGAAVPAIDSGRTGGIDESIPSDTEGAVRGGGHTSDSAGMAGVAQRSGVAAGMADGQRPAGSGQPAISPKQKKIYKNTVEANRGRTFTVTLGNGNRSVITVKHVSYNGDVVIIRQDYDPQGNAIGEPREERHRFEKVGRAILENVWKKELSTEEKLRKVYKYKVGDVPVIDVLTDEEQRQLLDAYNRGDKELVGNLTGDLIQKHREDIILRGRDLRGERVEKAFARNGRGERLRGVRDQYRGFEEALTMLSDEAMQPTTIEEYVADAFGDVPKMGDGFLAYTSYDKGGNTIVGLKDETGFGSRGFNGDTKGFNPWLAPKGKGMSLKQFAESIHETLPEGLKEQYSDQYIRNVIGNIMTGAEKPTDIANYILRNRVKQAEAEARHTEEQWMEAPDYQKVVDGNSFASRLQRAKDEVNTEPTEGQKKAGNYKKGHLSFGGYDFTIENPAGSMRRGVDEQKRPWEQKMNNTYGYILGKKGKDGDHLDMFINDDADLDDWNGTVYVVDQVKPDGSFDEHKILVGFDSEEEAREAYLSNYEEGWQGLGRITGVDKETFDKWLDSSNYKIKDFADYSIVKNHMVERRDAAFDSALRKLDEREISIDDPNLLKEYGLRNVTLSRMGDHLTLTHFIVDNQGQGNGTRFMEDLARLADEKGWTLALTPDTSFGGTSVKRLKDFYKRFGFKENKGRNADFYTRESMIRRPEDWQPMTPEQQEQAMRDAVVEHLKKNGIEVSDDWKEGQRILDQYNGSGKVKKMGSRVDSKKSELSDEFNGMELSEGQQAVADVYTGKKDNAEITVNRDGQDYAVTMRQGNENKAGTKHSLYRHYGTGVGVITADDIIRIPDVLTNGEKTVKQRGNVKLAQYRLTDETGKRYTVITELKNSGEVFNDFYTNKKAPNQTPQMPNGDTPEGARTNDLNASGAKVQQNTETSKENSEKLSQHKFFKTPDGHAYGFTYKGKIYVDPRIATTETPIHEYSHLWAEMKRQTNPEEWDHIKQVMLGDELVQPIIERVKRDYPELQKEGKEDDFVEEIITQFSGRRGAERLREIADEIAKERGGIFGKAEAVTAMQRMKNILNRFWEGVAKMMGWKYRNANQIADRILADMLNGVNPVERMRDAGNSENIKPAKIVGLKPKTVKMPEKQIEELYTEGLKPGDAVNMQDRVLNMSPKELIEQYRRVNSQMLDEDGLDIDQQEKKFRDEYFSEHGLEGFGKASADWLKEAADKYTYNRMALRWDLLDRIKELGIEDYIDKDIDDIPDVKTAEFIRMQKKAGLDVRTYDNTGTEEQKDENRTKATMDAVRGRDDIMFQKKPESKRKESEEVIADLSEPGQSDAAADAPKPQVPDENGGELINAEAQLPSSERKDTKNTDTIQEKSEKSASEAQESEDNSLKFQKVSNPEPEMTPEERQYWKKWDEDMKKWKERNAIPAEAAGPGEKPRFRQGENAHDFAQRLIAHNREKALWQTAPRLEDYRQKREDKDILEAAREEEKRYPGSQLAKMRRVAAELQQIRRAMSQQKAYDKATVKAVTDFAQDFMRQGFGDHLSRGEMERILSSVKNATGAKQIKEHVDNIMNILMDNQLRNLDQQVQKLSSVKELRQTAQGVEKQGKLELKGQRMIKAFREAREGRMDAGKIRERMNDVAEKMARNDEEAPMWEQEYEGLSIALQYQENIEASRDEYKELERLYKDAVDGYKGSGRSYKAQQELLESIDEAMMENKVERIGLFGDIIGRLEGNISESMQGAKEFVERDRERVKKIQQMANFDLAGKDTGAMREKSGKPANFFLQPLGTFEQMLKMFGGRNVKGEGYLYDYFIRNWMDSTDKAYLGEKKAKGELDAKAREVFGDKVRRWSDLYDITRNEKEFPGMDLDILDQENPRTFHLSQGNLLYIYMADKMADGRMKLRKMGIDEEKVQQVKDFLDPRLVQLGDWLQDEYLPGKRTEYNKVHERMFGAPMAAIDHYFPIKILSDARVKEEDVNVPDSETLPSTITGNIIKRRRNALPLDILHTDALSLAIEHVEDMERWAATAEWNRDINTLLSYTTFRNKVKNMKTIYGSGDALWNTFKDAARMAAGTYESAAKPGSIDKAVTNIAKGVTAAKINFRPYTALKQLLSAPAFLTQGASYDNLARYFLNPKNYWRDNFKWAIENMPVFRKRWESRQIGDTRLMDSDTDWNIWRKEWMQKATRAGMWMNAAVDALTIAAGARSIYETNYKKYREIGASEAVARKRALQDAEIGYNLTQQSSEGAFVSRIQKDRTVAANMLSVFRNSSMSYTRQWVDAARNLNHMSQKGYKEDSIGFMKRQMQEQFGLDEAQAQKAAEAAYNQAGRREVAKLLNMMFGVTVAWNLGASLPYLLLGDDDKTKKEMMTDALLKGLVAGPTEGMAAGNIVSDLVSLASNESVRKSLKQEGAWKGLGTALDNMGEYEMNPLPLFADMERMISKLGYDGYAAAQDLFNICVQSTVGVNPQTFTDMWNACMDYGNPEWMPFTDGSVGNKDLSNANEIALFIMRVMNAPASSWKNKYIDELGMDAEDARKLPYGEMAKRYANYKHWKDAPLMGWLRGEEKRKAKIEKLQQQFDKAVVERMERLTDDELASNLMRSTDAEEKRKYAKIASQRLGLTPGATSKKPDLDKEWYQEEYQSRMLYDDIREDEMLAQKFKDIRDDKAKKEIKKRLDWIRDGKYDSENGRKGKHKRKEDEPELLAKGKRQISDSDGKNADAIMKNIRKWRKEALEIALRAESDSQK